MSVRIETSIPVKKPLPGQSPVIKKLIDVCCQQFADAMQAGTDNEGYGSLIYIVDDSLAWALGDGLQRPHHCPWCGKQTEIKEVSQ